MLSPQIRRCSLNVVRHQTSAARRATSNDGDKSSSMDRTTHDQNLSNITVTSFYRQSAIEQLATKVSRLFLSREDYQFAP